VSDPTAPRKASVPGVGLAHDVASQKLSFQLAQVDTVNTRLGGAVAATIAVGAISVQATVTFGVRAVTVIWLIGALIESVRASLVVKWISAPDPRKFSRYAGDEPDFMKEAFLPAVLNAISRNEGPLSLKSWRLNWAIVYVGLALASLVVGRLLGVA
jgi:hypothetical protein